MTSATIDSIDLARLVAVVQSLGDALGLEPVPPGAIEQSIRFVLAERPLLEAAAERLITEREASCALGLQPRPSTGGVALIRGGPRRIRTDTVAILSRLPATGWARGPRCSVCSTRLGALGMSRDRRDQRRP